MGQNFTVGGEGLHYIRGNKIGCMGVGGVMERRFVCDCNLIVRMQIVHPNVETLKPVSQSICFYLGFFGDLISVGYCCVNG